MVLKSSVLKCIEQIFIEGSNLSLRPQISHQVLQSAISFGKLMKNNVSNCFLAFSLHNKTAQL